MILFFKRLLQRFGGPPEATYKPCQIVGDNRDLIDVACSFITANPTTPVYLVGRFWETAAYLMRRFPGQWVYNKNDYRGFINGNIIFVHMSRMTAGWQSTSLDAHLFVLSRMQRGLYITRQLEHRLPNRENVHIEYIK